MINAFRRTAATLSALAVIGGAGAGIASAATPDAGGPVQTSVTTGARTWFEPSCQWGEGFDWHYYRYCDTNYWHGGHFNDWQRFDHDNRDYDYGWRR
ncbi:hypothetical protein [Nocardia sp. NBC_01327]|uniref:hypothetical protein n=1 Tax=Nocardia sp. NBC_01327 TaxID=2903593 RepID=UPI002E13097B|nr:hypothetical protein OG326_35940 [Nocardia sp. NBC_01327]